MPYRSATIAQRPASPILTPMAHATRLALCSLLLAGSASAVPALAQTGAREARPDATVAAGTKQYNIPAGSLDQVLGRFGREAEVMIGIDPELTRNQRSAGLQGSYSVAGGLQTLLVTHQLEAIAATSGGYRLQRKAAWSRQR